MAPSRLLGDSGDADVSRGFDLDLRFGTARENALRQVLGEVRVEVKSDRRARETGNVFVELFQAGGKQPSGLNVTEAEVWAFEVHDDRWVIIPTTHLRDLAARAWSENRWMRAGDNDNSGVLVPVRWLVQP